MKMHEQLPETGRGVVPDPELPGLELRGNRRGASWRLRHRIDGKRVADTLGRWPQLSHAAARKAARAKLESVATQAAAGGDPLAVRAERLEAKRAKAAGETFGAALGAYAADRLARQRRGRDAELAIRRVFAKLLDRPLAAVTRKELLAAVSAKRVRHPGAADAALRVARPFTKWCVLHGRIEADPLAGVVAPQTNRRDTMPTLEELGRILVAAEGMGDRDVGALAVRTMIATAQRRGEVAGMRRAELDLSARTWTLPGARTKNGSPIIVPLNASACEAIAAALRLTNGELVFAGRRNTPYSGWSKLKSRIDAAAGVSDWTLHDLRRAFASTCASRGVDAHVADRCLNHTAAGTLSGVARIYQLSDLIEPRTKAMKIWNDALAEARALAAAPVDA